MKILYVTNMYPTEFHIYNGIHVKEQIDYLKLKYNIASSIYYIKGYKSRFNYLKSIYKINNLIKREEYDLIHIHFGLSGLFALINPFIKIPIILTIHGSDLDPLKGKGLFLFISKLVSSRVTRIIILNDRMIERLKKFTAKLHKIPCGVNIEAFNTKRNIDNIYFTIGFPGDRKRTVKNFELFNSAVSILEQRDINIKVIEFHGMTRSKVIESLSQLDCLLMTSLSEGSPQIIKEAMVSGVPIVSTDVGDVAVLLNNVNNCFVINSYLVDDFVNGVLKIINLSPQERRTNGKEKLISLELDQDSVCSKIYELYSDLINSKQ